MVQLSNTAENKTIQPYKAGAPVDQSGIPGPPFHNVTNAKNIAKTATALQDV